MFLAGADQFTDWHLVLLALLVDPPHWAQQHGVTFPEWGMGGRFMVVEHALPDLRGRRGFYDQVVRDLHQRGLLVTDFLGGTVSGTGLFQPLGTDIAQRFVAYVSLPARLNT